MIVMGKRKLGQVRPEILESYSLYDGKYTGVDRWHIQRQRRTPVHMTSSPDPQLAIQRKIFAETAKQYQALDPVQRSYFARRKVEVLPRSRGRSDESRILGGYLLARQEMMEYREHLGSPYPGVDKFCKQVFDPTLVPINGAKLEIYSRNRGQTVYYEFSREDGLFPLGALAKADEPWNVWIERRGFYDYRVYAMDQSQVITKQYYHLHHEWSIWVRPWVPGPGGFWIKSIHEDRVKYVPYGETGTKYYVEDWTDQDFNDVVISCEPAAGNAFKVGLWQGSHETTLDIYYGTELLKTLGPANNIPELIDSWWKVTPIDTHQYKIEEWKD